MSQQGRGQGRGQGNVHQRGRGGGVPQYIYNYPNFPPEQQPPNSYLPSHPLPAYPTTPLPSQNPPFPNVSIVVQQQPAPYNFDAYANHGQPAFNIPQAQSAFNVPQAQPAYNIPQAQPYSNSSWQTGQKAHYRDERLESNRSYYRNMADNGRDPPPHYFEDDRNNYTPPYSNQNSQHTRQQRNPHHFASEVNFNRQDEPHHYTSQEIIGHHNSPHYYNSQKSTYHSEKQEYSTRTRPDIRDTPTGRITPPPPYDKLPSNPAYKHPERTSYEKRADIKTGNRQRQRNKDDKLDQVSSFLSDNNIKGQSDFVKHNRHGETEKIPVMGLGNKNLPDISKDSLKGSKDAPRKKNHKKNKSKDIIEKSSSFTSELLSDIPDEMVMRTGGQAKHDFVPKMAKKVPLERQSSNASLPESEKSTGSEPSSSANNFGRKKQWKPGYQGKKFVKQNKEGKFKSMSDIEKLNEDKMIGNSQTFTSHLVKEDVQAATEKTPKKRPPQKQAHFSHKKTVDNTQQRDNFKLTQENQETFLISRLTKADIQMWKSFKDADNLKEFVCENIDTAQNETFSVKFVEDSIFCKEGLSSCTIIIETNSKQQGKRLIKNLCLKLQKKLKIKVKCSICGVDEDRTMDEQNFTDKEKQVKDIQSVSKEKQVKDIQSASKEKHLKKKGPEKNLAKNNIQKTVDAMLETVNSENTNKEIIGSKEEGDIRKKNKPKEIPTKVSVTIGKFFLTEVDLKKHFTEIFHNFNSYELVPGSFNSTTSQTKCQLSAPSKAASQKIVKKLTSKVRDTPIQCLEFNNGRLVQNLDQSSNAEDIQAEIKQTVDEITKKTEKTLDTHLLKIETYEQALKVIESSNFSDDDDDDDGDGVEKLAVFDKLKELAKQRDTFCSRRDELIEMAKEVTSNRKELSGLLQSVGVECERLKAALPIYARREDITKKISQNQVSVILGETGSGKSTQMTQYIHEAGLASQGMIVCTQPRKVAAITLAERVAKEMTVKVGKLVGYKTGLKKCISAETKIVFATDHCLLNECLADRNLSSYSCIIVDEAHERSIYTDLLLGMVKACLPNRPDLKVVITSATIDPQIFINYFKCSPELRVSGRTFPVELVYSDMDESVEFEDFEMKAVNKAVNVHRKEGPGDILVFLTSAVDIMRCIGEFEKVMSGKNNFKCFPLHGQLPPDEQKRVFERLEQGIRKIVFATNCAETSITIDGIKYVIDTGVAKEIRYDSKRNICMLGTYVISRSSANQRKGRAGRTSSGKCYRLYTEEGYNTMKDSSEPEILKVPLGQSVLKLTELGVDVKAYDFVQSPSAEAIDSALNSLRSLGALSSEGITDLGRWISKLPFSPKEGFIIYHGNRNNLLYDSIVLAALITNGSNLFYKGLTESEAQSSARSKSQFGSPNGDIFTWLEVYKAWLEIDAKQQSKWCQEKSINYKVMSFTKQCVKDVATILKNEFKIKLEYNFTEDESALLSLRKIIFEAYLTSVCCYLGHIRAGFHALMADRQVHIHPSSNLISHNTQPEWIVYSEFTKTSRDFIKGITVIEEDWVHEAVREGKLLIDLNQSIQQKIKLVHSESVGPSVFRKLVGVKYSQLRIWEDDLTNAGMSSVVVEADNAFGTFDIFSSSDMNQDIATCIAAVKSEVIEFLKSDEAEIDILRKSSTEPSGVRVMIGQGGCVKSLLMPDESNKILIKKTNEHTTDEDIRAKFGAFGDIKEYVRFKRLDPWGFIRYSSFAEAKTAVQKTCNDSENVAVLKIDKQLKKMVSRFEARLSWCRRPIKGKGTAFIKCPPIEKASLVGRDIMLPVGARELKLSKKGEDLVCFDTGTSEEVVIKMAIMEILQYDKDLTQNIQVTVVREQGADYSQRDMNGIKDHLSEGFSKYMARDKFNLRLMSAKKNAVNQVAFINFENPTDGFAACSCLQGQLFVQGQLVNISPTLKTTLYVPTAIMNVCKDRFNEIIRNLETYKEAKVHIRSLKLGDYAFDIKSEKIKSMIEARDLLQRELEGEIIDCKVTDLLRKLLKRQGKEVLRKIESSMEILIVLNERREQVHIYGSEENISKAQIEINNYLSKLVQGRQEDVFLRGEGKPPGLMKELMRKYSNLQDDLIQAFALSDVIIDFKQQKLSIFGSSENVDRALASISELESTLSQSGVVQSKKGLPDCVVCLCPVENCLEVYKLEACGHCYCHQCLKMQINVSEKDETFPIMCAKNDCSMQLVWKDFQFCFKNKWTTRDKLAERSVNACVATNPDKYRFCLTPNCPVIYEVTRNEEGTEFTCPSCYISLCTSCHSAFHGGLTCSMINIDERTLRLWVMEDPDNRKMCPGCHVGVEKISGCNKMKCSSCHTYFCWVCLQKCENEQKCYAHLAIIHGSFN